MSAGIRYHQTERARLRAFCRGRLRLPRCSRRGPHDKSNQDVEDSVGTHAPPAATSSIFSAGGDAGLAERGVAARPRAEAIRRIGPFRLMGERNAGSFLLLDPECTSDHPLARAATNGIRHTHDEFIIGTSAPTKEKAPLAKQTPDLNAGLRGSCCRNPRLPCGLHSPLSTA